MSQFLYKFINNLQECYYVISDIFKIDEVSFFWLNQINFVKAYLYSSVEYLQNELVHLDRISTDSQCSQIPSEKCESPLDFQMSSYSRSTQCGKPLSFTFEKKFTQFKTPDQENELKTSTPSNSKTTSSQQVIDLQFRVFNLEQEINNLKKQIETLSNPASNNICQTSVDHFVLPKIVFNHCPPPPPPPPPPSLNLRRSPLKFKRKRNSLTPLKNRNSSSFTGKLDMSLVLRGLKDVKLKHIERSPGGTPMRKNKPISSDPVNILQEALKKRFDVMHPEEDDKENLPDSWDKSPTSMFFKDTHSH